MVAKEQYPLNMLRITKGRVGNVEGARGRRVQVGDEAKGRSQEGRERMSGIDVGLF